MITAEIDARAVLRELNELEDELKVKVVRSGLREAGKPLVASLKASFPGRLAKTVNQTMISKGAAERLRIRGGQKNLQTGQVILLVGPNKKISRFNWARVGGMLEWGTKPHKIKPGKKGYLSIGGQKIFATVKHPGIRARGYMSSSMDSESASIQAHFYQGLRKHLDKVTKK